jgi:hypothetical protein
MAAMGMVATGKGISIPSQLSGNKIGAMANKAIHFIALVGMLVASKCNAAIGIYRPIDSCAHPSRI